MLPILLPSGGARRPSRRAPALGRLGTCRAAATLRTLAGLAVAVLLLGVFAGPAQADEVEHDAAAALFSDAGVAPGWLRTRWLVVDRLTREPEPLDASERAQALAALEETLAETGAERWPAAAYLLTAEARRRCEAGDVPGCLRLVNDAQRLDPVSLDVQATRWHARHLAAPGDLQGRARDLLDRLDATLRTHRGAHRLAGDLRDAAERGLDWALRLLALVVLLRHRARVGVDLYLLSRGWLPLLWLRVGLTVGGTLAVLTWPVAWLPFVAASLVPWARWRERAALALLVALPFGAMVAGPVDLPTPHFEAMLRTAAGPCDAACADGLDAIRVEGDSAQALVVAWSLWRNAPDDPRVEERLNAAADAPAWTRASREVLLGHRAWEANALDEAARRYHAAIQQRPAPATHRRVLRLLHQVSRALGDRDGANAAALQLRDLLGPEAEALTAYRGTSRHRVLLSVLPETPAPNRSALLPRWVPAETPASPAGPMAFLLALVFATLVRRSTSEPCEACGFPSSPHADPAAFAAGRCIACHGLTVQAARTSYEARTRVENAVRRHAMISTYGLRALALALPGVGALARGRALSGTAVVFAALTCAQLAASAHAEPIHLGMLAHDPVGFEPVRTLALLGLVVAWIAGAVAGLLPDGRRALARRARRKEKAS